MLALQAPYDEMAAGQRLKMVGEGGVDRRAADRAENRRRLRGDFLADHDAEAGGDFRNEPRDDRRGLGAETFVGDEARAVADRFGQRGADGEIPALERRLVRGAAEREDADAGDGGVGCAEILPFLARDLG